jgi:hypothetical protein
MKLEAWSIIIVAVLVVAALLWINERQDALHSCEVRCDSTKYHIEISLGGTYRIKEPDGSASWDYRTIGEARKRIQTEVQLARETCGWRQVE